MDDRRLRLSEKASELYQFYIYVDELTPEPQDIGVITPYHAQRCRIGRIMTGKLHGIKVGSVEEFQGQVRFDATLSLGYDVFHSSGTAHYHHVHCPKQHGLPEV